MRLRQKPCFRRSRTKVWSYAAFLKAASLNSNIYFSASGEAGKLKLDIELFELDSELVELDIELFELDIELVEI